MPFCIMVILFGPVATTLISMFYVLQICNFVRLNSSREVSRECFSIQCTINIYVRCVYTQKYYVYTPMSPILHKCVVLFFLSRDELIMHIVTYKQL